MSSRQPFITTKDISIIGVPFNGGQPREGVQGGPQKIIEHGLLEQIDSMGWKATYEANSDLDQVCRPESDPEVMNLKNPLYVSAVTEKVAHQVYAQARDHNRFVLTLGGDHSIALATVSGVFGAYEDACLIWVDAHAVKKKKSGGAHLTDPHL